MAWTTSATSLLIDLYRSFEVLYNVSDPLYHKKSARATALEAIVKDIQVVRPDTTVKEVTTKINSLRTQFSMELRDLKNTASGSGYNEYVPKMSFFTQLLFLQDHFESRKGVSNVGESATATSYENIILEDSQLIEVSEQEPDFIESTQVCVKPSTHLLGSRPRATNSSSSEEPAKKRVKKKEKAMNNESETLNLIGETLQKIAGNDEGSTPSTFQTFANFLAEELDAFNNEQQKKKCKRAMLRILLEHQEIDDEYS